MTQVDNEYNYFNIFLCARCLTKLEPSCRIPEVPSSHKILLSNLEENFDRILLNTFENFLLEFNLLDADAVRIKTAKLPYFFFESEFVKTLLDSSFMMGRIENLETVSKLLLVVLMYSLQYLADFVKLCQFLRDDGSMNEHFE
jgi:hypothetical protein